MAEKILSPILIFFGVLVFIWAIFYGIATMFRQQAAFAVWSKKNLSAFMTWLFNRHFKFVAGFVLGVAVTIMHLHYVCHLI